MKKYFIMLSCIAALSLCGCSKETSKVKEIITNAKTWSALVKDYPFLSNFPEFRGDIENVQYREIGGSLKTVTFFDYACKESVATTYFSSFAPAGFNKSENADIYRKSNGDLEYIFTGGYAAGSFALSFSENKN